MRIALVITALGGGAERVLTGMANHGSDASPASDRAPSHLAGGTPGRLGLVVVALNADRLLVLTVGEAFGRASGALVLQMAAVTLVHATPGATQHRPAADTPACRLGSLTFYVCLVIAVPTLGVSGASLSHLVFNAVWLVVCMAVFESRVQQTSAAPVTLVPGPEDEP